MARHIDEKALCDYEEEFLREAELDAKKRAHYQRLLKESSSYKGGLRKRVYDPMTGEILMEQIPTQDFYRTQKDTCKKRYKQEMPLCGPRLFEYNSGIVIV